MPSQKEGEGTGKGQVPIATDLEGLYFVVRTRTHGAEKQYPHPCMRIIKNKAVYSSQTKSSNPSFLVRPHAGLKEEDNNSA